MPPARKGWQGPLPRQRTTRLGRTWCWNECVVWAGCVRCRCPTLRTVAAAGLLVCLRCVACCSFDCSVWPACEMVWRGCVRGARLAGSIFHYCNFAPSAMMNRVESQTGEGFQKDKNIQINLTNFFDNFQELHICWSCTFKLY